MRRQKGFSRRRTIKVIASVPALPVLTQLSPPKPVASHHSSPSASGKGTSWTPKFFNPLQNETVSALAELIIPQTETPGAKAAKVNEFVDLILSEETAKVQQEFLRGLEWIDQRSTQLFNVPFNELSVDQQTKVLEPISSDQNTNAADQVGVAFFKDLKSRTIFAYYTSEVGIHQELQYKGLDYLTEFPGCRHPEHLNWDPKD